MAAAWFSAGDKAYVMISSSQTPRTGDPVVSLPLVLFALALGGFGIGTTEFVAMGLLPQIAAGIHVSIPVAGHSISAYALGVVVGAPLIAILSARLPRKALLIGLMGFFAAGNFLSALAPDYHSLIAARFIAGLPHGAYFGVAALVAASLAGPARRAQAVARVMLGLSAATLAGVPLATWLGQAFGWQSAFALAGSIALLTMAAIALALPAMPAQENASMRTELGALHRPQVWLTLGIAAIGFGGLFSVYSYIAPILTEHTGLTEGYVPVALAIWGAGMVTGGLLGGWLADKAMIPSLFGMLISVSLVYALFALIANQALPAFITLFLLGTAGFTLGPALQTRLMDVAGDAQTLAAALNHAAFNLANALGAWLGGLVLLLGWGWTAPSWVGVALASGGLLILCLSVWLERRHVALADTPTSC